MEYVNFGSTGLKVSRLALGTMSFGSKSWRQWVLDEEASHPSFTGRLSLASIFDTADMYSLGRSERFWYGP
jgi:aryl-alcohol dehydrogenase (NADP+)